MYKIKNIIFHKINCPNCNGELITIYNINVREYDNCKYCGERLCYNHFKQKGYTVRKDNKRFKNKLKEKKFIGIELETKFKEDNKNAK